MSQVTDLARVIAPIDRKTFFSEHWEKKPLVVQRNQRDYFSHLLDWEAIDRAITTLSPHHPEVGMYNALDEVKAEEFTLEGGLIDIPRLFQRYSEGATIILQELHARHAPLADLCRAFESEFSHRFQTNIYVTPANAQGFKTHFDSHDVFAMQVHGSKQWLIYDEPVKLPYRGQRFQLAKYPVGQPTMEFVLHAGDMVYIPRGVMHDARTTNESSIHITLGALTNSWTDLILESLALLGMEDPDFRKALTPGYANEGFDMAEAERFFRDLLKRAYEKADLKAALTHFAEDFTSTRYPNLRGQLAQMNSLESLKLESRVGRHANLIIRWEETDEHVVLSCYGNDIKLPKHAGPSVRFAVGRDEYRVSDIPDLDDDGKLVLARRLIREGLIRQLDV